MNSVMAVGSSSEQGQCCPPEPLVEAYEHVSITMVRCSISPTAISHPVLLIDVPSLTLPPPVHPSPALSFPFSLVIFYSSFGSQDPFGPVLLQLFALNGFRTIAGVNIYIYKLVHDQDLIKSKLFTWLLSLSGQSYCLV